MNYRRQAVIFLGLAVITTFTVIILNAPAIALNQPASPNQQDLNRNSLTAVQAAQNIPLTTGWNMISSYIAPTNPDIDAVIAGLGDNLVILKNGQGEIYWPDFSIDQIGSWQVRHGYQVYVENPATLTMNGDIVDVAATPITLGSGFHLIPYFLGQPMAIDQALNSISGQLYLVKNGQGQIYWPDFNIYEIGDMQPGQGYEIYMTDPGTLTYPQAGNTPTPTPTPDSSCPPPNPNNILANPSFESGENNWTFYTNGSGDFTADSPAYHCDQAARIAINTVNNNMQLNQTGFPLSSNTTYRLSFAAFSNSGRDLNVFIHKNQANYANYGLNQAVNLNTGWQTYAYEFTTSGFSGTTNDTRLRFWFVGGAANGDVYWIDNVVLEPVGGPPNTPTPTPVTSETPPPPTATPDNPPTATPTPSSGGGDNEMLVFDWNKPATEANRGFPFDQPPMENGDWTQPINYAEGTFYFRVEIFDQPEPQNMRLQFCVWQAKNGYNFELETCGPQEPVVGTPGTVATWSRAIDDMWKKNKKSLEWWRPRFRNGVAIKNSQGQPVSNYNGWNWNGEDPKKWYPLDMRFTVVVVEKGGTFSGWQNYIN